MSIIMIFNRKVIPVVDPADKNAARVECAIVGFIDGESFDAGQINFPSKQSWTKFWGAVQRGALAVPDLEVKMQNVPIDGELEDPTKPPVDKKWVGNVLVDK